MWRFPEIRGADVAIAAIAVTALITEPAWAGARLAVPGPAAGILAGGAIIAALVIAKWWRRK